MALNNYNENLYLPLPLRTWLNSPNKVSVFRSYDYLRMFDGYDLMAILNNKFASDVASGYTQANRSNLMSGIAPRLQEILVSKIVNKVDYIGYKECEGLEKELSREYLTLKIKKAFNNAIRTARDIFVLYNKEDALTGAKHIEIQNVEAFRHILKYHDEKIVDVSILVNQSKILENSCYNIFEHRYYNKDGKPVSEYVLTKMRWENTSLTADTKKETISKEMIDDIKKTLKADDPVLSYEFNKPKELPFENLGVFDTKNGLYNSKYPHSNIPESRFVNLQDKIMEIENSITYKEVDKNIGRGRTIVPSAFNFSMGTIGGNTSNLAKTGAFDNPLDSTYFVRYNVNQADKEAAPQGLQFDIRADQWRTSLAGEIGDLCAVFGISVLDFDPRLLQTGQRTDDEINAMTDITADTVANLRSINEYQINLMLNTIAKYLGYKTPIAIKWNIASIINPTKNAALITMQLQNGTISRKKAIQRSNPDYTDEEVEEELKAINEERALQNPLF
jgi:hypothetical protein